jgi:hypothetical protein
MQVYVFVLAVRCVCRYCSLNLRLRLPGDWFDVSEMEDESSEIYCYCRGGGHGQMVGCDNSNVRLRRFVCTKFN